MKIQIMSDLHLEFGDIQIENKNNADVLVLAGDITTCKIFPVFKSFLNDVSKKFKHIVHVNGNHGAYGGSLQDVDETLSEIDFEVLNYHYLNISHITIEDFIFVGGTLWTNFNKGNPTDMYLARTKMNDYRLIKGFTPVKALDIHTNTVKYIEKVAKDNKDKFIVVVSHHAPSLRSLCYEYCNDLDYAYASDLSGLILDNNNIGLFIHGHIHQSKMYNIGECQIVCNPRGYVDYEENSDFDANLTIEV